MAASMLQPVKAESLSAQVAANIREAIFRGELKPGQVIRELGLARNLNVSQATVREALAHLEHFGLVVRKPNRSTSVTSLSPQEVKDRLRVRMVLECLAFSEASHRLDDDGFQELMSTYEEKAAAIEARDAFATMVADRRFHHRVWELSGNPVLLKQLDQLTTPLFAFLGIYQQTESHQLQGANTHRDLIEAMRSKDDDRIIAAVRKHVEETHREFMDQTAADISEHSDEEEVKVQALGV